MCYMYLSAYAEQNPEITLLVVNTMQKDCADEDPMVRGLAVRSLTSLRLPSITEYSLPIAKRGLEDLSGYVRKASVMAVLKLFHSSPEEVRSDEMTTALYNMVRDREPGVVVNALRVLDEMLSDEGGVAINQPMMHHLLGRIREFNDWDQCTILDLVARYRVEGGEEETYGLMNVLDGALRNRNSAVGLATVKAFLHLTATPAMADIREQVYERCRTPLLTLLTSASPESTFVLLAHVKAIAERAPAVFADEYKTFFCALGEPTHVQELKLSLLAILATEGTAAPVVNELCEYVTGVNEDIARSALTAIGEIAVRLPGAATGVVRALIAMLDTDADWVCSQAVQVMQVVLRKYPDNAADVLPALHATLRTGASDPEGRAAAVWIIGQFGTLIDDAPYLLEPLIDAVVAAAGADGPAPHDDSEAATALAEAAASVDVRLELLTAAVKLFFARPPEMQKMLARLLSACLVEGQDVGVRDRALLYFRLLRAGVAAAKEVVCAPGPVAVTEFLADVSAEIRDKIFNDFNSLSVVYVKPPEDFVPASHRRAKRAGEDVAEVSVAAAAAAESAANADPIEAPAGWDEAPVSGAGSLAAAPAPAVAVATPTAAAPAPAANGGGVQSHDDDLDFFGGGGGGGGGVAAPASAPVPAPAPAPADDFGDLFGAGPTPAAAPVGPAAAADDDLDFFGGGGGGSGSSSSGAASLDPAPVLAPPAFQSKWSACPPAESFSFTLRVADPAALTSAAASAHFVQLAFGDTPTHAKFFFFAREAAAAPGTGFHLVNMAVDKSTGVAAVDGRSEAAPAAAAAALAGLKDALS